MPLINKQPFKPNPIPDNLGPDDEVFYHELTNEIFVDHDAFFDRFLYCNSLIWTCGKTGKSGLTYKEALDSEQQGGVRKRKGKNKRDKDDPGDGSEPIKKKKKKYPYDPKKYSMPVPEGFDPSLLTPTGKIDGRKLKSKKNKQLAEELLQACQQLSSNTSSETKPKKGRQKKDDAAKGDDDSTRKEEKAKKKAQTQAELARERELEAKRKKEAAALAKQMERQKKEEERKKAASFLQNWEKKCEDLERDDLRRLPHPTPLNCEIPERLFGDAVFILESLYNLQEIYNFNSIFPEGLTYDTLEDMLIEKQPDGPLGTVVQYILRLIFDTQPTGDGYGLDDDLSKIIASTTTPQAAEDSKQENSSKIINKVKMENNEGDLENETTVNELDDDDENVDKDVNMNDLIGSAIKAAQEVKKSLSKSLPEMELNSANATEILRLHLLQSGSFPKGRTIYNGWYSSREDPGLWLCMQEPDLIKKLGEVTIYDLEIEERIKILHTLIYQLFSFIKTRWHIESASEQLTELRKQYRSEAAAFGRWDRENCVKRMQTPKKKGEQNVNQSSDRTNGHSDGQSSLKTENNQRSNPCSVNGDLNDGEFENGAAHRNDKDLPNNNQQLKSCLKSNGTSGSSDMAMNDGDDGLPQSRKKQLSFKTSENVALNGRASYEADHHDSNLDEKILNGINNDESDQTYEEQERTYLQNLVDYEDYQRERAFRLEQLNQSLLSIRTKIRNHQSIYGVHPIGRDRAYRRYWLFRSLPGLFVEHDDDYIGRCLPNPTPLESRYKKLFNKENPLMHTNESDLIRTKTCDVACSTEASSPEEPVAAAKHAVGSPVPPQDPDLTSGNGESEQDNDENHASDRLNSELHDDQEDHQETEPSCISDEMNYCTADETTCAVHGHKRLAPPRWWFYHLPESVDHLVECLNKRGYRESELLDVLSVESTIIKPWIVQCPAHKLNKKIMEQSGIRRSRRLKTKGSKGRRGRHRDYD